MESRPFQFTIRGLVWATFWAAVSAASWRWFALEVKAGFKEGWLVIGLSMAGEVSLCIALWALLGRPVKELGYWVTVALTLYMIGSAAYLGS